MKHDEVMALTDEGLWQEAIRILNDGGTSEVHHADDGRAYVTIDGEKEWMEDSDFPNDIAAAWGLVGSNPDWRWAIYELDDGGWVATPMAVTGVRDVHRLWGHVGEATADIAPRAITRAFILAHLAEE